MENTKEKEGGNLDDVRCKCGKIVCQVQERVVLIKCRHCKRYVTLDFGRPKNHGEEDATDISEQGPKIEYK